MTGPRATHDPSPSRMDGEGVRIVVKEGRDRPRALGTWIIGLSAAFFLMLAVALFVTRPSIDTARGVAPAPTVPTAFGDPQARTARAAAAPSWTADAPIPERIVPSGDPNDLASYVRPGDPAPSGANLIRALQDAGIRTGIGAFNPPGTSPPLEGLAVPEDFVLPEGYVRHHQVTDEGEPIEAILMFSPDAALRDAQGRAIALPADRVVTPGFAPPGLPIRWVRPGTP